ncbi:MAG: FGGY-family carbohydrate kinase [Acidimicrobiales bacterium]
MTLPILVVDVGTSGVRAAIVQPDATVSHDHYREVLPRSPAPGFVEFDASVMAEAALDVARRVLADGGPVAAVGIANQRASTVVWDRATGDPVGPGVGWQDLRTAGVCLMLQDQGIRLAPNVSATKAQFLLDMADPDRSRDLCFGTVDTWIAWTLSGRSAHVTDSTNAALTGLRTGDGAAWNQHVLDALRIPEAVLPAVIDSSGVAGEARPRWLPAHRRHRRGPAGLAGRPGLHATGPGQDHLRHGRHARPLPRAAATVLRRAGGRDVPDHRLDEEREHGLGVEAIMLSAGTNIEWLRDDLGLIATSADSHDVAAQCSDTEGVVFVPALLGLGTPAWDYGARGTLLGVTRGTGRAQVVRAVLEGIAQRGADLVEAAEADGATVIPTLRVDGGMSANPTFIQALADATQRRVEVSPVREATTLGAAFLAGLAIGTWADEHEICATWRPRQSVEPGRPLDRARWRDACSRSLRWVPELSALDF